MKLCFDSIEEVKAFVGELKGTRGRKGQTDTDEGIPAQQAPAPLQPPAVGQLGPANVPSQGFPGAAGFAPPVGGARQEGGAFPAAAAPALGPEVQALVSRIVTRVDGALASGQPADQVLSWFRTQCGPEAANATLDQIKTVFLAKLSQPALEGIAKLMNA